MLINTAAGTLKADVSDLVRARGVRYATASRFSEPKPYAWDGVLDATRPGPACPQPPSSLQQLLGPTLTGLTIDENCQVLSVVAPPGASGLPVMVWFHGGAYITGSGESAKYDPSALVREGGVVVVNVSYRLGVFGYLTGNLGLMDQLVALRWVRDNISAFGGDPANVTAFGQSAGGDSVYALAMCDTENLFRRAIIQSAPLAVRARNADDPHFAAKMVAAMRAAAPDLSSASCAEMLEAQQVIAAAAAPFGVRGGGMPFGPHFDEAPMPPVWDDLGYRDDAHRRKVAQRVELLIGYTSDDGAPYVADQPELWPVVTEQVFAAPARGVADDWFTAGGISRMYLFRWRAANAPLGACHCAELPFLFDSPAWDDAGMLAGERPDPDLAREVRRVWTGFAHRGKDALTERTTIFG